MKRALVAAVLLLSSLSLFAQDLPNGRLTRLPGMRLPGMVTRESNGIPHVFAFTEYDLHYLTGWLHASDRLFQMDASRRIASGTMAELVGSAAIPTDVQLRTFGLRRAAEATLPTYGADARAALEAYSAGVNAWIAAHPLGLPPEYALLEINQIPEWTPVDSIAVGKLIAFGLSFDLDVDPTVALLSYQQAGTAAGFNGTTLFFADTWRSAPFSRAATIPDATGTGATLPESVPDVDMSFVKPETLKLAKDFLADVREIPLLAGALDPEKHAGSNEWAIAPRLSTTGNALIANDPHLALTTPATFYPISLRGAGINVAGMGFPGAPFVIQGQNERIAWGSTVHPMDVTDIYQEQLVPATASPSGFASVFGTTRENVLALPQTFRANVAGNGRMNDLQVITGTSVPPAVLVVPRHGPVIRLDAATGSALSLQYAGLYPTHELEAFMRINRARNVDEFRAALQFFDVGSQNFAYADVDGNIAYFTSGELPIREDLAAGRVAGSPPYLIRNGTGGNEWLAVRNPQPNQALPFEILPYAEMPQVVNPSNGWFVNANNDPTGHTLDGDPLNTPRAGNNGILYLNPGYDGIRAGRITQLIRQRLASAGRISPEDMKAIQADVALLDAQVFVPFIVRALENARAAAADPALAALGNNAAVQGAVLRLSHWDFTTPTGIPEGFDAAETNGNRTTPSQAEIDASVAATIYSSWRSLFLTATIGRLATAQLPLPPAQQALSSLRFQLENYATTNGRGLSGFDFFGLPMISSAAARRDFHILNALSTALSRLQGAEFEAAFHRSTDQNEYRWGKLHRVVFSHHIGNLFSIAAPFGPPPFALAPDLPGVPVDGGFGTVDAASHNGYNFSINGFMFSSGPNRRYVGDMSAAGIRGESSLPGGVNGDPRSPWFSNLLMLWLTNDTYTVTADSEPRLPWVR